MAGRGPGVGGSWLGGGGCGWEGTGGRRLLVGGGGDRG